MFQTDGVNPSSATNCNSRRCCRGKKTTSLNNISSGLLLLLVSHFTCQRRRRTHRCQSATTSNLLLFSWTAAVAVWLFSATPAFAVAKGKYPTPNTCCCLICQDPIFYEFDPKEILELILDVNHAISSFKWYNEKTITAIIMYKIGLSNSSLIIS